MKKAIMSLIACIALISIYCIRQGYVMDKRPIVTEETIVETIEDQSDEPLVYIKEGNLEIAYNNNVLVIDKIQGLDEDDIEWAFDEWIDQPEYTTLYSTPNEKYLIAHYTVPSCGEFGDNIFVYIIKYNEELNTLDKVFSYNDININSDLDIGTKTLKIYLNNLEGIQYDVSKELDEFDYRLETLGQDTIVVTRPYKIDIGDGDRDGCDELDLYYPLLAPSSRIYFNSLKITYTVEENELKLVHMSFVER